MAITQKKSVIEITSTQRGAAEPGSSHWRWDLLQSAPHRLGFASGAFVMTLASLWWAAVLIARHSAVVLPWAVPPAVAHSVLMSFGFMPLFFLGFLFTAGPKWLGHAPVPAARLTLPVTMIVLGWCVYVPAVHLHQGAAAAGVALAACGWSIAVSRFVTLVRSSGVRDRQHAQVVVLSSLLGAIAWWGVAIGLGLSEFTLVRIWVAVGLWGFAAMVYVSVAHRMIPFFTANVVPLLNAWRPLWLLGVFVGALLFETGFSALELVVWSPPLWLRIVQVFVEALIAIGLLALAVTWGLMQSLRARLLAMLHVGFVWLGLTFMLQAVSHAMLLVSDGRASLSLAPLHALSMGFMGALLIAMATRVSVGHSGRRLVADDYVWSLFWIQQCATVLRLLAAAWPGAPGWLTPAAASLWALATTLWALRYGSWFGRPRPDGQSG